MSGWRHGWIKIVAASALLAAMAAPPANAQQASFKIGLIAPMTGSEAAIGKQIDNAATLYLRQNGDIVAGRKIEILLRDGGAVPDQVRRAAKELIANDKVDVLAGFGTSPAAIAVAPLAAKARIPQIVMGAGTSLVTDRSPFIVRSGATLAQSAASIGTWAAHHGLKKVVTLVSDFAPGRDALAVFEQHFTAAGGEIIETLRVKLNDPDFSVALVQAREAKPDALFVFVPPRQSLALMTQARLSGLDRAGIKLIGPGDIVDDDVLDEMGDAALGVVTAHFYSAAHLSPENMSFVTAYLAAFGERPGFTAVASYDGMHLICEALKKTQDAGGGEALLAAMKGMAWESPRGPMIIDPHTREVVQNIYLRRVEKVGGENYNIEFETLKAVKDVRGNLGAPHR